MRLTLATSRWRYTQHWESLQWTRKPNLYAQRYVVHSFPLSGEKLTVRSVNFSRQLLLLLLLGHGTQHRAILLDSTHIFPMQHLQLRPGTCHCSTIRCAGFMKEDSLARLLMEHDENIQTWNGSIFETPYCFTQLTTR